MAFSEPVTRALIPGRRAHPVAMARLAGRAGERGQSPQRTTNGGPYD
jgi:hypothetical protein